MDNALKRPKNYKSTLNLEKYKESEQYLNKVLYPSRFSTIEDISKIKKSDSKSKSKIKK